MVFDPKERMIHAARFPERVLHYALMNLCEPVLERQSIFHSYAYRKCKGRLKAIEVAKTAARKHAWHLKLDIRKYFSNRSRGVGAFGGNRKFITDSLIRRPIRSTL